MRKSSLWKNLVVVAFIGSAVAFVATFPVRSRYEAKADLVQRVEVNKTDALLLGKSARPIGSPQRMIIIDEKAFVPGEGESGARLADDGYMKEHNIYPLQLKSVDFIVSSVRVGCLVVMALSLGGFRLTRRTVK
jgi:hypothetical protein